MADLNIDFVETMDTGNKVEKAAEEFQALLKKIREINNSVEDDWGGKDSTGYKAAVESQAQKMQKLGDTVNGAGFHIKASAQKYSDTSDDNTARVSSIPQ